jgi:hypothetical protein
VVDGRDARRSIVEPLSFFDQQTLENAGEDAGATNTALKVKA